MQINSQIIRLPLNVDQPQSAPQDVLTSALPAIWNGTNLRFELGCFYSGAVLNIADFDSILVEVKDINSKTGLPYMAKTVPSGLLDNTLDLTTWNDGTKQHAYVEFDHTETSFSLPSDIANYWLVISAIVNSTSPLVATASTLTHVGAVATFTSATPHGFKSNQTVVIAGEVTYTAYNGTYVITVTGANAFTYTMGSTPGGNASAGATATGLKPNSIVLAAGQITVMESGYSDSPPSSVISPTYFTAAQSDARYVRAIDITTITNDVATANTNASAAVVTANAAGVTAGLAMPLAGGHFSGGVTFDAGLLYLSAHPIVTSSSFQAATKGYVDSQFAGTYVPLNGSVQMTGDLVLKAVDPVTINSATRRTWANATFVRRDGTSADGSAAGFTGEILLLNSTPSTALAAASRGYVDAQTAILLGAATVFTDLGTVETALGSDPSFSTTMSSALATKLPLAGGNMTGVLNLSSAQSVGPTGLGAISKNFADITYLTLNRNAGMGNLVGDLVLSAADPITGNSAARKTYVDNQVLTSVPRVGGNVFTGTVGWLSGTGGIKLNNINLATTSVASPVAGMLIFDTSTGKPAYYSGTSWNTVGTSGGSGNSWQNVVTPPTLTAPTITTDYAVDTTTGNIYSHLTGSWALVSWPDSKLSLTGGAMNGGIIFGSPHTSIAPALRFYSINDNNFKIYTADDPSQPGYDKWCFSSEANEGSSQDLLFSVSIYDQALNIELGVLKIRGSQVVGPRLAALGTCPSDSLAHVASFVQSIVTAIGSTAGPGFCHGLTAD